MCNTESYNMSFVGIADVLYGAMWLAAEMEKAGWGNKND